METDTQTEPTSYYSSSDWSHYTAEDLAPPIEQFMEGTLFVTPRRLQVVLTIVASQVTWPTSGYPTSGLCCGITGG